MRASGAHGGTWGERCKLLAMHLMIIIIINSLLYLMHGDFAELQVASCEQLEIA
jgi:hypothetical protein